jgi:hypothetical protein
MKKILYVSLSAIMAFSLSSCLKDKGQNSDFLDAKEATFIEITEATADGRAAQPLATVNAINNLPVIETFSACKVRIGGQTGANTKSINYTISVNNAILPSGVIALPAGSYTILNPTGTIVPGTDEIEVKIKVDKTTLGFTNVYGVGFQLTSNNATVNDNAKSYIGEFLVKNIYDGVYSLKGYTLRAGDAPKTGNFCCQEMDLETAGAAAVNAGDLFPWADLTGIGLGGVNTFTVNTGTNAVTTTCVAFPSVANAPGYNTRYEPNTKTFYVSFTWGAGPAARLSTDTMTWLRPRP